MVALQLVFWPVRGSFDVSVIVVVLLRFFLAPLFPVAAVAAANFSYPRISVSVLLGLRQHWVPVAHLSSRSCQALLPKAKGFRFDSQFSPASSVICLAIWLSSTTSAENEGSIRRGEQSRHQDTDDMICADSRPSTAMCTRMVQLTS